jgi:cytochrome c-type biogenesis protein CcmH
MSVVATIGGTARLRDMIGCVVFAALTFALALAMPVASADTATPASDDPVLEARVAAVAAELRCLVCQNQSLADSHADLAIDLKNQVREMLRAGKSEADVKAWMTERYGDFVLYKPPVRTTTWLLWAGPFVLLAGGAWWLARSVRRRRAALEAGGPRTTDAPLAPDEAARLERLLGRDAPATAAVPDSVSGVPPAP